MVFRLSSRILFFLIVLFVSQVDLFAQDAQKSAFEQLLHSSLAKGGELVPPEGGSPQLTAQAAILIFLALLPFLIMLLTAFLKIVITLTLLRTAAGLQQTPPNQVINGIALIMTIYVMSPTAMEMYQRSRPFISQEMPSQLFSRGSAAFLFDVIREVEEPMRQFLVRNSHKDHLQGIYKISQKALPEEIRESVQTSDFIIAIPAFITTQIRRAFEIGALIFLPFYIIDIITSNILLAMQLMLLSPLAISLPAKLLLLVMVDGWTILIQGLALSFN